MAKVNPIDGKMTGKIGGRVYAVSHGVNIVREKAESVANPSTAAQVASRARLKLLSQLSAAIKSVIAIRQEGLVTARNQFTKKNYAFTSFSEGTAQIQLADMQLTKSNTGMVGLVVDRSSGNAISVQLTEDASNLVDAVVYTVIRKTDAGMIIPFDSCMVSQAGELGLFPATLKYTADSISVHVYGIKFNSASAREVFSNINSAAAESVASVVASRTLNASEYVFTETRGLYLPGSDSGAASGSQEGGQSSGEVANVANPVITGTTPFAGSTQVQISCATAGATIHYTLDGSTPTVASPTYSAALNISDSCTVKAIALVGAISSGIVSKSFVKQSAQSGVAAPQITGQTPFDNSTQVTISAVAGASIKYTTNGVNPTATYGNDYEEPITLNGTAMVKAVAIVDGVVSSVASAQFVKNGDTGGGEEGM